MKRFLLATAMGIGFMFVAIGCGSSGSGNAAPTQCTGTQVYSPSAPGCVENYGGGGYGQCQYCYLPNGMLGVSNGSTCQLPNASNSTCGGYNGGGYNGGGYNGGGYNGGGYYGGGYNGGGYYGGYRPYYPRPYY